MAHVKGKLTELRICEYLWNMFEENELMNKSDEALKEQVLYEFRNHRIVENFHTANRTIQRERDRYNRGETWPSHNKHACRLSFRYNDFGELIRFRRPEELLNESQQRYTFEYFTKFHRIAWTKVDDRYQSVKKAPKLKELDFLPEYTPLTW